LSLGYVEPGVRFPPSRVGAIKFRIKCVYKILLR